MTDVLGIWHLVLEGEQEEVFRTPAIVQITNVSYGEELADAHSRSVVKLTFGSLGSLDDDDDEESSEPRVTDATTVLCALTPGKVEHATLNITLSSDEGYKLQNTGKNTVYLTGHYLDTGSLDSDSELDTDGEDAYHLGEVSSDVEMHPDDLDGLEVDADRFEELDSEEATAKTTKRPRESVDIAGGKAAEKKKKLKAEDGKGIPVQVPSVGEKTHEKKKKKKEKEKKEDGSKNDQKVDPPTQTKTVNKGGVVIQDHIIGTGPMAKKGDTVKMRYVGKLTNGKEFDKNVSGKPFTFHLGKGEVIKGWDEGIVGMQAGGERILKIPAAMAYGNEAKNGIPSNSDLIFELKLLVIKSKA